MALPDLFSRRKRNATQQVDDVYIYGQISQKVRVQIVQIIGEVLGPFSEGVYSEPPGRYCYENIVRTMRKEKGVFELYPAHGDLDKELFNWILNEPDTDTLLDGIEYSIRGIARIAESHNQLFRNYANISPAYAIAELNARLQEAGIGYQFEGRNIIQVSSQLIHSEVVLPALQLISDPSYASADKEFRSAHSAFRSSDYETCLVECAKAFESTLKIIGIARKWSISATDPASKLLAAAFAADFIPSWMQAEFTSLRSLLESAVPTVRNKMGGHGAGATPRQVPKELAAFQLHQTAACIVFLIEHHKATA